MLGTAVVTSASRNCGSYASSDYYKHLWVEQKQCLGGSFDKQKCKKTIVRFFFSKRTIHLLTHFLSFTHLLITHSIKMGGIRVMPANQMATYFQEYLSIVPSNREHILPSTMGYDIASYNDTNVWSHEGKKATLQSFVRVGRHTNTYQYSKWEIRFSLGLDAAKNTHHIKRKL